MVETKTVAIIKDKKIRKMGDLYYISIDKSLFDTGVLSMTKKYEFPIEEVI